MNPELHWRMVWMMVIFSVNPPRGTFGDGIHLSNNEHEWRQEIFLLNLEHGYFGCQVNSSSDVLQIFDISRLCDDTPQCFFGSDEVRSVLKCSDDCERLTGHGCANGVCLDGQCHCNNKYGGLGCEVKDENECTYRPCDVFATCLNTLGSFQCRCFKGYDGDGFRCTDIDECNISLSPCGENAVCHNLPGHFECLCRDGFGGDPYKECKEVDGPPKCPTGLTKDSLTSECIPIQSQLIESSQFECHSDADCTEEQICQLELSRGKRACIDICHESTPNKCPPNSECVGGQNHIPICECSRGFTRNASQCSPIQSQSNGCVDNSQCSDSEMCSEGSCVHSCNVSKCNDNGAVCVATNHQAMCVCAESRPTENAGSASTNCFRPCVFNNDCHKTEICDRLHHVCVNPCSDKNVCGNGGAICSATNHDLECVCPEGTLASNKNGELSCITITTPSTITSSNYTSTSQLLSDEPEPPNVKVCDLECGYNAGCRVAEHGAECVCNDGYEPSSTSDSTGECVRRVSSVCVNDTECATSGNSTRCVHNTCKQICRHSDECAELGAACVAGICVQSCKHASQCSGNELCANGFCISACKTNADCSNKEACHNQYCSDPCEIENVCGPNALCQVRLHSPICFCPEGFSEHINSAEGCFRKSVLCSSRVECPTGHVCVGGTCLVSCGSSIECARNEVCKNNLCRTNCFVDSDCQPDHICTEGTCQLGCRKDSDCPNTEECIFNKCRCGKGFVPGLVGCVDVDECATSPCNSLSELLHCVNTPGSFKCVCSDGTVPLDGHDCPIREVAYINKKCSGNNCSSTICSSSSACEETTTTKINKCDQNSDCPSASVCVSGTCRVHATDATTSATSDVFCSSNSDCAEDESCVHHTCENPCLNRRIECGLNAQCVVVNHSGSCECFPEHVGDPAVLCRRPEKQCSNFIGDVCVDKLNLLNGTVDAELGNLQTGCSSNDDCPHGEKCQSGHCISLTPVCPPGAADCDSKGHCRDGLCETSSVCLESSCDASEACTVVDGRANCSCKAGTVRNPLGLRNCVREPFRSCNQSVECTQGFLCLSGACKPQCRSEVACLNNEQCVRGVCQMLCLNDLDCGQDDFCEAPGICVPGCNQNSACASHQICDSITKKCISGCSAREQQNTCGTNSLCKTQNHEIVCYCPYPLVGDAKISCVRPKITCSSSNSCPEGLICVEDSCQSPCQVQSDCTHNELCVANVCRMTCTSNIDCDHNLICGSNKICGKGTCENGFEISPDGQCICPSGMMVLGESCIPCLGKTGWILSANGSCVCDSEYIVDANGDCVCPLVNGITELAAGNKCQTPVTDSKKWRTDFPSPEMTVNCLADGIQVDIAPNEGRLKPIGDDGKGREESIVYVKGYSKNPQCRRSIPIQDGPIDFKVKFGECGLTHSNGEANFVLVIQNHMKLVTHAAQAFNIKCVYMTGEKVITLDVDVSMITTMGTIANTGPPPNCFMRIVSPLGEEVTSAQIGDLLILRVEVLPSTIYGGFVRNCVATTMDGSSENEYYVTDGNGCALEPTIFSDWEIEQDSHVLFAQFNAFKFPGSSSIKFQCNVRVCFGKCPPIICSSSEHAYGRKRRDVIGGGNDTQVLFEGQLREEVTVYSNPILAIERPESRLTQSSNAQLLLSEDVCLSSAGLVAALALTGVSAILTVSIALLIWIFCRRNSASRSSHLKHPSEFPNPLVFTRLFNPVPEYVS